MRYLLIVVLAFAGTSLQAETYKWTEGGKTVISDTPPPGKAKAFVKTDDKGEGGDGLPFAVKKAATDFPVTLYTSSDCGDLCVRSRELLTGRGIPFTEKLLQSQADADELKALIGEVFVPTIKIGKQNQRGFDSAAWHNLLDLAGYPKTAPFGSKKTDDKK